MSGKEYRTITDVKGPLVFLNKTEPVSFGEIVQLRLSDGSMKNGQVLDTSDDQVIVQVFEGTASIDKQTGVKFLGDVFKLPVSKGGEEPYTRTMPSGDIRGVNLEKTPPRFSRRQNLGGFLKRHF